MASENRLFDMPSEILGYVAQMIDFHDLARLFLSGNRRLKSSLQSLKRISISLRNTAIFVFLILNQFISLKHLSLNYSTILIGETVLFNLPSTLVSLKVIQTGPNEAIKGLCDASRFNVSLILPNIESLKLRFAMDHPKANWFATLPSSLHSLEISNFDFCSPLPASLTYLKAIYQPPKILKVVIPPNLVHLSLGIRDKTHFSEISSFLASMSLETLDIDSSSGISKFIDDLTPFESLPKSLVQLKLGWTIRSYSSLLDLPRGLTDLQIISMDANRILDLPPGLTRLHMKVLRIENQNGEKFMIGPLYGALPRNLTDLRIERSSLRTWVIGSCEMPRSMVKFRVSESIFWDELSILSFPSHHLISCHIDIIGPSVHILPSWPHLRKLWVKTMSISSELFHHLALNSTQLESIVITDCHDDNQEMMNSNGENNKSNDMAYTDNLSYPAPKLSRFLKNGNVLGNNFRPTGEEHEIPYNSSFYDQNHIARFSRYLKSVYIGKYKNIGDDFLIKVLPDSVEMLSLVSARYITDLGIQSLSIWINLTVLRIPLCKDINGTSFKWLPRHLKTLIASKAEKVYNDDIALLPRSLTRINLDNAIHLTNECGYHIPPGKVFFSVRENRNFSNAMSSLLPAYPSDITVSTSTILIVNSKMKK